MATVKHNNHMDFHWTVSEFIIAFLAGVIAVGAIWAFTGLLIGLFFI